MKKITFLLLVLASITASTTFSQVAINSDGESPNSKSMLDVKSTTKGILIPRMLTSERITLGNTLTTAEKGMMVYDTEKGAFYYFDSSSWVKLAAYGNSDDDWTVNGDNMYSAVNGDVGIGINTNFQGKLDVIGKIYADNSSGDGVQVHYAGTPTISPVSWGSSLSNGFEVNGAEGNGVFVGAADKSGFYVHNAAERGVFIGGSATGVWVDDATTDGVLIYNVGAATENYYSSEKNGLEIAGVEGNGVFVGQADQNGFYAKQVVNDGINIEKAGNPTTILSNSSSNGFEIQGAEGNGVYVGIADEDGINVYNAGAPSDIAPSASSNGIEIQGAEGNGIYVGRAYENGVRVVKAGNPLSISYSPSDINGFEVNGAEGNGVYVGAADKNGVQVSFCAADGMLVGFAGAPITGTSSTLNNGIEIQGAQGNGVYVGNAYEDGLQVFKVGAPTTFYSSTANNGLEIQGAQGNGVYVGQADNDGVKIYKAGTPAGVKSSTYSNGIEINGAQGNGVYVGRVNRSGIEIDSAGQYGISVNNAINDGIVISKAGTTSSTAITSSNNNGIEVPLAQGYGLYVGRTDVSGVYVESAAGNGVHVESAIRGLYANNVDIGVKVNNASDDGIVISKAGTTYSTALVSNSSNGVEVQLSEDNGIYIGQADHDGIQIAKAGSPSSTVANPSYNDGIEIQGAENGVFIGQADHYGVFVDHTALHGVYVFDAVGDGVHVNNADDDGVYAKTTSTSNEWGIYTPDKIHGLNVTSKSSSTYGKNIGNQSLKAGDVVCIAGGMENNIDGTENLFAINLEMANDGNRQAVFGVVEYKVKIKTNVNEDKLADNQVRRTEDKSFAYADGDIYSGDYFSVIILGPAEVNVDSKTNIKVGDNVCIGNNGVSSQRVTEINGISIAENVGILGKAIGKSSGSGKMLVYVNCK